MAKILMLEDEQKIADAVLAGLAAQQHVVEHVLNGDDALDRLKHYHFDLAILDWTVPGISGAEVCKQYRESGGKIPVLMLTGMHNIDYKEEAFQVGADDYITKPFNFRELVVRIKALLRRPQSIASTELSLGNLKMDLEKRLVTIGGASVDFKSAEYSLLELFMKAPGKAFGAAELISKLFSSESEATDEAVRQRIFRLRKLLNGSGVSVKTLAGQGYRLELDA